MNDKINETLVSVIMPTFNSAAYIEDAINSVISQTYQNWELLIVNDGSKDNTSSIVKEFLYKEPRIKYYELKKNYGPGHARNKAITFSNGKYIAFLDSDDKWVSTKLEIQIDFMQINNLAFTFTAYQKINKNNKIIGRTVTVPEKLAHQDLLKSCVIGCLTVIYDVSKLGKMYMPLIKRTQDYGLWLNILKKVKYGYGLNDTLSLYRIRKDSISSNKIVKAYYQWQIYRKFEKLSLINSIKYMSYYTYYGYKKYKL